MAQVTEDVCRDILNGQGYTDHEVKQLAHAWLRMAALEQQNAELRKVLEVALDSLLHAALFLPPKSPADDAVEKAKKVVRKALAAQSQGEQSHQHLAEKKNG